MIWTGVVAVAMGLAPQATANDSRPPEIVVTGIRPEDSLAALKVCLARQCPAKEDVAATLTHAETLFVAGRYADALATTTAGVRRNRRHAPTFPTEVAGLMRANSRIASHMGETSKTRISMIEAVETLRAGLGANSPELLVARLELADRFAEQGQIEMALNGYRRVAEQARAAGHRRIEGYAKLYEATTLSMMGRYWAEYRPRAERIYTELANGTVAEHRPFAAAALMGLLQLNKRRSDAAAVEALIAAYRRTPTTRPQLLSSDPIRLPTHDPAVVSATGIRPTDDVTDQWVDVAFFIASDGTPRDIEILRTSNGYRGEWGRYVTAGIATRRYAPLALTDSAPSAFRVERFTKTAPYLERHQTNSRFRVRSPQAVIRSLDLSIDPPTSETGS